jgi:hypothetical protein
MTPEADDILKDMERLAVPDPANATRALAGLTHLSGLLRVTIAKHEAQQMDKLLGIVEAQKELAESLDRQTATLVTLTRAVMLFTVVLMVLTVGLLVEGGIQFFEFHKTAPQHGVYEKQTDQTNGGNQHTNK